MERRLKEIMFERDMAMIGEFVLDAKNISNHIERRKRCIELLKVKIELITAYSKIDKEDIMEFIEEAGRRGVFMFRS